MSRRQQMKRSKAEEPTPEPAKARPVPPPEEWPAVALIREGAEGYRVVLMTLPRHVMNQYSLRLSEPDTPAMTDALVQRIFQNWRENGVIG